MDKSNCEGIGKLVCEAKKKAKNTAAKIECEARQEAEKKDCERIKAQEQALCAGQSVIDTGTKAMRDFIKVLKGPRSCDANDTLGKLLTHWQDPVGPLGELLGFATTPLKRALGGWDTTGCEAVGIGIPYRDAVHSTDDFWTIDVQLVSFSINGTPKPGGDRFIRLEIQPRPFGGKAHDVASGRRVTRRDRISFGGPVLIDNDPPRFLEVHPIDVFEVLTGKANDTTPSAVPPQQTAGSYTVTRGDSLSRIAERVYGKQVWRKLYTANAGRIKNPDLIYPDQILVLP